MSRTHVSNLLREQVSSDARYRCGYCLTREEIVGTPMELDHIVPEALGGLTVRENLWLACSLCNNYKSYRIAALDPTTGEISRLFDPRRQRWNEHFRWSLAGDRATAPALQLNRPTLVSARRAWVSVGWHPPTD
jgi:hypothetical protein